MPLSEFVCFLTTYSVKDLYSKFGCRESSFKAKARTTEVFNS